MEERKQAKEGGAEASGYRSGAGKSKKQNLEAEQRGHGKEDRRVQREATVRRNAAQAAVRSGFRGSRKGQWRPHHPSTHHGPCGARLSPCRRQGRTGRRKLCSCSRHRCPAPRWSRSRTGFSPPRSNRGARGAKGQTMRLAPLRRAEALGEGGRRLAHLGAPHLFTASACRPRPLSRPRPTPTSLSSAPKSAQLPSRPLLTSRMFPHCGIIHLCGPLGTCC